MFDAIAPFYDLAVERTVGRWVHQAADLLDNVSGWQVVDLCTGTGIMARELVRRGARVTGVDISRSMLARARKKCPGAVFQVMDIMEMRFPGPFDAATISMALHGLPPAGAARVLWQLQDWCRGPLLALDWARRPESRLGRWLLELVETGEGSHYQEYMKWGPERLFAEGGWKVTRKKELGTLVDAWLLEP
ncbi:MAG: methyltransferase domain-containing protein [Bacillota bacterium]